MGKKSRDKGYRGEHEAQQIAEAAGLPVKRSFMSGMFEKDGHDLEINSRPVSVKRRKNGMDMFYKELEKNDYVLFRADNRPWLKVKIWEP